MEIHIFTAIVFVKNERQNDSGYLYNKLRQFFVSNGKITTNQMSIVQLFSLTFVGFLMLLFLFAVVCVE